MMINWHLFRWNFHISHRVGIYILTTYRFTRSRIYFIISMYCDWYVALKINKNCFNHPLRRTDITSVLWLLSLYHIAINNNVHHMELGSMVNHYVQIRLALITDPRLAQWLAACETQWLARCANDDDDEKEKLSSVWKIQTNVSLIFQQLQHSYWYLSKYFETIYLNQALNVLRTLVNH